VTDLRTEVDDLLRRTARAVVLPLYQHEDSGARQKRPGDWVTEADHRSEALLGQELAAMLPGSVVVGEEAVSVDPSVLDLLGGQAPVWLIDPVDGTRNYVSGTGPFAMMVALVEAGSVTGGWIHLPLEDRSLTALAGLGTRLDDAAAPRGDHDPERPLVGAIARDSLPPDLVDPVSGALEAAGATLVPTWACSGRDYPSVVAGEWDFLLPWTVMPWDHAAGSLAVQEAGGRVARLDGTRYSPAAPIVDGLLVARTTQVWDRVRGALAGVL
jgi:fructose-1,6-bisphosphatase/inositol monophosphatase family enzyme